MSVACTSGGGGAQVDMRDGGAAQTTASAVSPSADPVIREELEDVLRSYFGELRAPRLALLEVWEPRGFDPNETALARQRIDNDPGGPSAEELLADNRRAFATELVAIETGDLDSVGPWFRRRTLNRTWRDLEARRAELGDAEFERRATALFSERYPDLDEAAEMFAPSCARCHADDGAGDGILSHRVLPKPRNFEYGVFKFVSVPCGSKPLRNDLLASVAKGLPGTAMPAFEQELSLAELSALVDYVRYLSIRGEVTRLILAEWERDQVRPRESVEELYALVWERWLEAADNAYVVNAPLADPDPDRLALGDAVFHDPRRGNCASCHGDDGRGNGPSAIRIGADGKSIPMLRDDWGVVNLPHDLTDGLFRGGTRREDVYLRIQCGIPGTPMPALGESTDAQGGPLLSEEETWALVDYVLSLSGLGASDTH